MMADDDDGKESMTTPDRPLASVAEEEALGMNSAETGAPDSSNERPTTTTTAVKADAERHRDTSTNLAAATARNNSHPQAVVWWKEYLSPSQQEQADQLLGYVQIHKMVFGVGLLAVLFGLARLSTTKNNNATTKTVTASPSSFMVVWIGSLLHYVLWMVAVSLGVGLGLGLAAHVYDLLTVWKEQDEQLRERERDSGNKTRKAVDKSTQKRATSMMREPPTSSYGLMDEQTYASLMQSSGYTPTISSSSHNNSLVLRGQVLRNDHVLFRSQPLLSNYTYYGDKPLAMLQSLFPVLPHPVQQQLAYLMDYIVRDFCAIWCCKLDAGCANTYDAASGALIQPALRPSSANDASDTTSSNNKGAASIGDNAANRHQDQQQAAYARRMIYQLNPYRNVAIMEQLYHSLTIVFGNLATRAENINVPEFVLLKATKVLAHTFKVYRSLRKSVMTKNKAHISGASASATFQLPPKPPTEMQMTKEFLLAGKLHRAVTFGLDVPSLLFADANGKECGWPNINNGGGKAGDPDTSTTTPAQDHAMADKLLEERLFHTGLMDECEMDYNRVLAHRMARALLSRNDFGSGIVSSIITEILGESVLPPLMSCFCPEYLNGWIVAGLATVPEMPVENVDGAGAVVSSSEEGVEVEVTDLQLDGPVETDGSARLPSRSRELPMDAQSLKHSDAGLPTDENRTDSSLPANDAEDPSEKLHPTVSADLETEVSNDDAGDKVNTLLAMTLIDLQHFVDFEEFRMLRSQNQPVNIDWDDPGCREAILRLVLVIEQTLSDGRCNYKRPLPLLDDDAGPDQASGSVELVDEIASDLGGPIEATVPDFEYTSLSQILMEMTSDIDAFEDRIAKENVYNSASAKLKFDETSIEAYKPTPTEQSTLRTLIAAWLHSGQIFRVITVLVQAHTSVLAPYFAEHAFLRSATNANGFVRQLKALDGVEILVDTMMVLSAPRLDETSREDLNALVKKSVETSSKSAPMASSSMLAVQQISTSSTPRYLDFNRNESFATSLRTERDRRMRSWHTLVESSDSSEGLVALCHASATDKDAALYKELHDIARIFYSGTNVIAIRDAARKKKSLDDNLSQTDSAASEAVTTVSLLTVETASARRRIEIPDDDSSFLLRAQPRPLNAVGVHRDQRNHDQSFKSFAATYDEPALTRSEHYSGGRYIRGCLVRYYPIDRTATVSLQDGSARRLDQRQGGVSIPETITVGQSSKQSPLLSTEFLKERHLCQRWTPKGTNRTQGIMSSSVLEPTDFNLMPRTGRAIDFVYRLSLFERPMVDLGGVHFTVNDSTLLGTHRADASSLELSDSTLSAALYLLGDDYGSDGCPSGLVDGKPKNLVEMGDDGYPIIWMKYSRGDSDNHVEIKPYRISFVRAAMLITGARHEAQLQNLLACVRSGSAKNATKALTDRRLRPTAKVLEYASSRVREKQSILLRDLKLGVNHIDREQLRRNGLLSPRYPTVIRELTATVEETVDSTRPQGNALFAASDTLYRIRCQAIVDIEALDSEVVGDPTFRSPDGSVAKTIREEWVVLRSYDDFNRFHKHLKAQVSVSESSGNAGTRLVGAATAAFAAGAAVAGAAGGSSRNRLRVAMIPSLGQASKASLGPAKKLIQKRKEALDAYLKFLLAPKHLLNRSTELLIFLGAVYPLPREIVPNQVVLGVTDPLGRTDMSRKVLLSRAESTKTKSASEGVPSKKTGTGPNVQRKANLSAADDDGDMLDDDDLLDDEDEEEGREKKSNMLPAIESKISKVPLAFVRRQLFELLHYLFGFENASFVRNRMLTAIKTMSFAVTTGSEFKRTLYKLHCEKLSSDAVAGWISFAINLIWPNGEFFTKAAPSSPEELREQSRQAMEILHSRFPEQIRSVLGPELTRDGLNILHEMLQNRLVVKSLFYILMDMLWSDVFPELGDVTECGAVLDLESKK